LSVRRQLKIPQEGNGATPPDHPDNSVSSLLQRPSAADTLRGLVAIAGGDEPTLASLHRLTASFDDVERADLVFMIRAALVRIICLIDQQTVAPRVLQ